MARTKLALLYVGGSIGMKVNQKTGRIEPIESINDIHRAMPELQRDISLDFFSISNIGSSDITPEHWVEISEKITQVYDQYEGFIVVHGTNTMVYTACALSFALQNLSKPIVITGSYLPINDIESDAKMNLMYAVRAAQLDIAEVCIVLGPRVIRGCRAKKVDQSIIQPFDTPKFPSLVEFDTDIHLHEWRRVRRKRTLESRPVFDSSVVLMTMLPGMSRSYLDAVLQAKPHGIVLRTYGQGMLSDDILPWVRKVCEAGIPIVFISQVVRGKVDLHRYKKQLTLEKLGVISGKDMTFECAVVKLMWALTQTKNHTKLQQLMEKSLVGELEE